jgi:hypothetical protein
MFVAPALGGGDPTSTAEPAFPMSVHTRPVGPGIVDSRKRQWKSLPPEGPTRSAPPRRSLLGLLAVIGLASVLALGAFVLYVARDGAPGVAAVAASRSPSQAADRALPPVDPATGALAQNMAVGQTLVVSTPAGGETRVTVTDASVRKFGCGPFAVPPKGVYLVVDVEIVVVRGSASVDTEFFTFQDLSAAQTKVGAGELSGCARKISGDKATAGTTLTATLVFDVPDPKGRLVYLAPGDSQNASWLVP